MKNKIFLIIDQIKKLYDSVFYFILQSFTNADFAGDGLICINKTLGFRKRNHFLSIIEKNHETNEDKSRIYRLHTLWWAAQISLNIEGDFVECGVYRGFFSKVICELVHWEKVNKTFWLYDSFCGFSPDDTSYNDFYFGKLFFNVAKSQYQKADHYAFVNTRFQKFNNVKIMKGFLPDTLDKESPSCIAYLHMDLNSPKSELLTLEKLYPKVSTGAPMIFDDYGWKNFKKQQEAVDSFFTNRSEKVLELPTGQGLVIKNK